MTAVYAMVCDHRLHAGIVFWVTDPILNDSYLGFVFDVGVQSSVLFQ